MGEVIQICLAAGLGSEPAPRLGSARSTLASLLWAHAESLDIQNPELIDQRNALVMDAVEQEQEALAIREAVYGVKAPHHRLIERCHRKLAMYFEDQQMWDHALHHLTKLRDTYAATIDQDYSDYWYKAWVESRMGAALLEQERYEEAEPLLLGSYTILKSADGVEDEETQIQKIILL